ncbi:RNA-binding protein RO60-like isoform X1 [Saccostrea echinata]|uniref:RNA-binding protein RO60-like isoform X1 n=1 Tax=Saccostrea echinata TaxID=191078 RepID=UPI002A81C114|nr:RNA-binding protein RO60-like isoform X1 [Saccostrea echinata]
MSMTALIRNLGKMSNLDMFIQENQQSDEEESFEENLILGKLQNRELILMEKVHPVIFLKAINQYKKGHNSSEKTNWAVLPQICTALENGFYLSFENIRPTGKRFLVAVEISKSMKDDIQVPGTFSLRAIDVAAFMVTLAARTEQHSDFIVFSSETPEPLSIQSIATIEDVIGRIQHIAATTSNSASDASWVFKYAMQEKKRYDAIVIYTDSKSCKGHPHPVEALKMYRKATEKEDVRLVVCNLSCSDMTIGDIEDKLTMTICGFDSHCPQIIMNFVHGIL